MELKDHNLDDRRSHAGVAYEERPLRDPVSVAVVEGLFTARIEEILAKAHAAPPVSSVLPEKS